MRIRDKFIGILGVVFLNVLLIAGMSLFAMAELQRYQTSAERGAALITQSRTVFNLMKDLSITAFAPDTYGRLKDVFYYEKFDTTLRDWSDAVAGFRQAFRTFMDDRTIRQMARAEALALDEYRTASTMSEKAFTRLESVMEGFRKLAATGYLSKEDSYQRIVSSSDLQVAGLFSEVRVTSYYLRNNFESFMNHFVNAMVDRIEDTRRSLTWFFLAITLLSVAVSLTLSVVFGNRILKNVGILRVGMARISRGDFSLRVRVKSRDELGELSQNINSLADGLKTNVDRLLHITRDVGSGIDAETDLDAVRRIIVATAGREAGAGGTALLPQPGSVLGDAPPVTGGLLDEACPLKAAQTLVATLVPDEPSLVVGGEVFSSLIVCPLRAPGGLHGSLVVVTALGAEPFTDLDFIILRSYADFAALSIENYLKYRQLIELREAEYQSLQARIQPHFLYNVLNGLIGLNRMGDKTMLEAAVLDLKDLLRYTLDGGSTVPLSWELAFVRKYLDLQKLRFGERFEYSIACDPACENLPIPKLLLQPLAENALIHGIELLARPGRLTITAAPVGRAVRIVIEDNGAGFDPAEKDLSVRVGLLNVSRRLEMSYPGSGFTIDSAPGQGCRIEILVRSSGGPG